MASLAAARENVVLLHGLARGAGSMVDRLRRIFSSFMRVIRSL